MVIGAGGKTVGNFQICDSQEVEAREEMPKASPSGFGNEAPPEPYAHFEAIRQAQKDRRKWANSKRISLEVGGHAGHEIG